MRKQRHSFVTLKPAFLFLITLLIGCEGGQGTETLTDLPIVSDPLSPSSDTGDTTPSDPPPPSVPPNTDTDSDTALSLEIHHINVQQGDATLIIGPDGTTLLIDAGNNGKGTAEVVPYLKALGISGLDHMVATHRDSDHIGGLDEVITAGYDVRKNIWDNGSDKAGTASVDQFLSAAATTTAGPVTGAPLGQTIDLGHGAKATVVAVGGKVIGGDVVSVTDENDKSVALLIQYGPFDYMTAGDLGGGDSTEDHACTGRSTDQKNVESTLALALMPGGKAALLTANGLEVMRVSHHGSESSTNHEYMNLLTPTVALISVGAGQGSTFQHPRKDIVEQVLLAEGPCITAPKALVLQTEEGEPVGTSTSTKGYAVGDIVLRVDNTGNYRISASGQVSQGPDERAAAGLLSSLLSLPVDH